MSAEFDPNHGYFNTSQSQFLCLTTKIDLTFAHSFHKVLCFGHDNNSHISFSLYLAVRDEARNNYYSENSENYIIFLKVKFVFGMLDKTITSAVAH